MMNQDYLQDSSNQFTGIFSSHYEEDFLSQKLNPFDQSFDGETKSAYDYEGQQLFNILNNNNNEKECKMYENSSSANEGEDVFLNASTNNQSEEINYFADLQEQESLPKSLINNQYGGEANTNTNFQQQQQGVPTCENKYFEKIEQQDIEYDNSNNININMNLQVPNSNNSSNMFFNSQILNQNQNQQPQQQESQLNLQPQQTNFSSSFSSSLFQDQLELLREFRRKQQDQQPLCQSNNFSSSQQIFEQERPSTNNKQVNYNNNQSQVIKLFDLSFLQQQQKQQQPKVEDQSQQMFQIKKEISSSQNVVFQQNQQPLTQSMSISNFTLSEEKSQLNNKKVKKPKLNYKNQIASSETKNVPATIGNILLNKLKEKLPTNELIQNMSKIRNIQDLKSLFSLSVEIQMLCLAFLQSGPMLSYLSSSTRIKQKRLVVKYLDVIIEGCIDPNNFGCLKKYEN